MKSWIKRIVCGFVALAIVCTGVSFFDINSMEVNAASVSSSEKKKIEELCQSFQHYFGVNFYFTDDEAKKYAKKEEIVFSKWGKEDKSKIGNVKNVGSYISNLYSMESIFGIKGVNVDRHVGDWGVEYPIVKVTSVTKKSSTKYIAKCDLKWVNDYKGTKKVGNATFTLKKKSKSKYGFVVKSLSYKMTAGIKMALTKKQAQKGITNYLDRTMSGWENSGYFRDVFVSGNVMHVYVKHTTTNVYQCFIIDRDTLQVKEYAPMLSPYTEFDEPDYYKYYQGTFDLTSYL